MTHNKAVYSAEGLSYPGYLELQKALQADGILSGIGTGCLSISPELEQIAQAQAICKKHGASFRAGYSGAELNQICKDREQGIAAGNLQSDAQALLDEFT